MPSFLIEQNLRDSHLLPITGRHLRGGRAELVAARRANRPHGPVAERIRQYIREQAPRLTDAVGERSA